MFLAIVAAFLSAAFFGASSAVQQRAASHHSVGHLSGVLLLAGLAQERRWWLGLAMSGAAFALHAVALSGAMLSQVQPIIVSGLVFAVFVRAGLERQLPRPSTIAWCMVTWVGLAAFIAVVRTGPPEPPDQGRAAVCLVVGTLVVVGASLLVQRVRTREWRGLLYGLAAGILFGLVAGLVKMVLDQASAQWWLMVTQWPFWALVLLGVGAIMLNQHAFQATRLSVSMPMVNIADVLVAITFGVVVFGEPVFSTPTTVTIEILALVAMGIGVRQLASRSEEHEGAGPHGAEADRDERLATQPPG